MISLLINRKGKNEKHKNGLLLEVIRYGLSSKFY